VKGDSATGDTDGRMLRAADTKLSKSMSGRLTIRAAHASWSLKRLVTSLPVKDAPSGQFC
jgi:hypothetical protein